MYESLRLDVSDRIARVTFTTPDSLNSITEQRLADLRAVVDHVRDDESIRVLSFTGTGRAFCVGLDLGLLQRAFAEIRYFESVVRRLNAILLDLEALPLPVVAAVNGFARAGGFELALACDFMLIADEAKIGDNHAHVGVMPGGGSTQRLPRRIGEQRAKELIFRAHWLTGTEAAACGLALRSVPLARLAAETDALLEELSHRPRALSGAIKRTIHDGRPLPLREGIELEIASFVRYMGDEPYAREGFRASLAKQDPDWY